MKGDDVFNTGADVSETTGGNDDKEDKPAKKYPLEFTLTPSNGQTQLSGEAAAVLTEEYIRFIPSLGNILSISFTDIVEINRGLYRITLHLATRDKLELYGLGYNYEDFVSMLFQLRNEMLIKVMLMNEKLLMSKILGAITWLTREPQPYNNEECSLYLFNTGLVITTEKEYPIRIPYSLISEARKEYYKIVITLESSECFILSQMGTQFDMFIKALSDCMNELTLKTQKLIKEMLPKASHPQIQSLSKLMKDGIAAKISDICRISPMLWKEIDAMVSSSYIGSSYSFLKSLGQEESIAVGLKRGLLGDLTGEYIWFLIPIYNTDGSMPGNAIAMEAASSEGGGRATYFFRILSRKDYCENLTLGELQEKVHKLLAKINYCMLSINFRREPIYIDDKKLQNPENSKYSLAVRMVPELKQLRELFIGRVIHSNEEQWRNDVMELLKFNVEEKNDNIKWKKNKE